MTPKDCWSPRSSGVHFVPNRKSPIGTSPKKANVSRISENTIASVVTTETIAAPNSSARIVLSMRERREGRRAREGFPRPDAPALTAVTWSSTGSRSGGALGLGELLLGLLRLLGRQRDDLGRLGDVRRVGDHVVHERLDLGAVDRLGRRIHEQRPRQGLVRAALDRLHGRLHAPAARVHADQIEPVLRTLVVGEAEVAQPALVALDAGDELVVVLGGLIVLARDALLAVDLPGEEVERPRIRSGPVERQLRRGQT